MRGGWELTHASVSSNFLFVKVPLIIDYSNCITLPEKPFYHLCDFLLSQLAHMQMSKHILYLTSTGVTWGIHEAFMQSMCGGATLTLT